ncbi:MAG: guanylate kinase [Lachnospiraceae bacterium]|nr:guanylate kinase [Lachnospiraceae bacterium]
MGRIFYLMGKSSTGKDSFYKQLISDETLRLKKIVMYTTRPIRAQEKNGEEYFFVNDERLARLEADGKVIERRSYNTVHGVWHYFTVCDDQIDLTKDSYVVIGTLESYVASKKYFGEGVLVPIYIEVDDGVRLQRALDREREQSKPKYREMCRRFIADSDDFSEENIAAAGITRRFENDVFEKCLAEITDYICEFQ